VEKPLVAKVVRASY